MFAVCKTLWKKLFASSCCNCNAWAHCHTTGSVRASITSTSSDHSETSWLRGIALSLLPSFPLSALGWYYKRKSQKITNKSVKDETMQQVYEEQQNTKMTGKSGEEVLPLKCLFYIYNSICLKSIDIGFEIVCVYVCFCCCCCCCCCCF